ncbi:ORF3 [torque teno Delphinidae virus 50]
MFSRYYRSTRPPTQPGWDRRRQAAVGRLQRWHRRLRAQKQKLRCLRQLVYAGNVAITATSSAAPGISQFERLGNTGGQKTTSTYTVRPIQKAHPAKLTSKACYTVGETKLDGAAGLQPGAHPQTATAAQTARECQKILDELYTSGRGAVPPPPYPAVTSLSFTLA